MGTVQNSHSLVREPGMVCWRGGSHLFAERFASATGKVAARRAGTGGATQFIKTMNRIGCTKAYVY